ncbi:MAG: lipoyl synthase [Candidatus Micrarchaeaceae archaeon]
MLPEWLVIKPASTEKYRDIKKSIANYGLHTVCVEAHCPNITECWSGGTATFMVLGDLCTRGCRFCAVSKSANGLQVDRSEPYKLAKAVKEWGLEYVVVTSVCRDDLEDQGAGHFARCVSEIKKECPNTIVEVLIPDFKGEIECLKAIADAEPDVVGHNIETVRRLSPYVRDRRAEYDQSLKVLADIKSINKKLYTKSAIMLGIGESEGEVLSTMDDLRAAGVDFIAIGQYLRPSQRHIEVKEYVSPEKFEFFRQEAARRGFIYAASGPFVRSSYRAGELFISSVVRSRSLPA